MELTKEQLELILKVVKAPQSADQAEYLAVVAALEAAIAAVG